MSKIKKGDTVILITGRDKGRKGAVLQVLKNDRVRVEGLNMSKKHQRPNPNANPPVQGGIIERESSVHISNVMHFNPTTQKGDRVAYKLLGDGRKVRIYKSNKEQVDAK